MDISQHLLAALNVKKMTQKALSEKLGIAPAYINKLCKGTKNPSIELLDKICNALELSPSEFFSCLSDTPSMRLNRKEINLVHDFRGLYDYEQDVVSEMLSSLRKKHLVVPQFSSSSVTRDIDGFAAAGVPLFDPLITGQVILPEKYADKERYIIVEARGDSMAPEIHNGDCVVFERLARPNQGGIALVHLETETPDGEYTIKRFFDYGDRVELRSINPDYPTIFRPISAVLSAERIAEILTHPTE